MNSTLMKQFLEDWNSDVVAYAGRQGEPIPTNGWFGLVPASNSELTTWDSLEFSVNLRKGYIDISHGSTAIVARSKVDERWLEANTALRTQQIGRYAGFEAEPRRSRHRAVPTPRSIGEQSGINRSSCGFDGFLVRPRRRVEQCRTTLVRATLGGLDAQRAIVQVREGIGEHALRFAPKAGIHGLRRESAAQLPLAPTLFPVGDGARRAKPPSGPRARVPLEAAHDPTVPACFRLLTFVTRCHGFRATPSLWVTSRTRLACGRLVTTPQKRKPRLRQPLPLDEAIQALKRDPSQPVRVRVDEELTVEVRAVEPAAAPKRSAADAFRELGRWEGETGTDFDALFADIRQRSNRQVPDLP